MGDHRISGCRTISTPVPDGLVVRAICVETLLRLRWLRRAFLKTVRASRGMRGMRGTHVIRTLGGRGTRGADSDTMAARLRAPDPISGSCVFL